MQKCQIKTNTVTSDQDNPKENNSKSADVSNPPTDEIVLKATDAVIVSDCRQYEIDLGPNKRHSTYHH